MIGRIASFAAIAALIFSFASLAYAATDPGVACAVAKHKAAVKKLSEKMKCHDNALKKGVAVDGGCLTKAEGKFEDSFAKAEAKGGCLTTSDAATIEATIDDTLVELLEALPATTTTTTTSMTTTTELRPCPPTPAEICLFSMQNSACGICLDGTACDVVYPPGFDCALDDSYEIGSCWFEARTVCNDECCQ